MEIKNIGVSITENKIEKFEGIIKMKIPIEFRTFLLKYNGGVISPDVISINNLNDITDESFKGYIYSLNSKNYLSKGEVNELF